jgi:hypothetical protein
MLTDEITATQKFAAVDRWLRARTSLPIWWSEVYVQRDGVAWTQQRQATAFGAAIANIFGSGASAALLWGPQADNATGRVFLWTNTNTAGGGQASVFYNWFEAINRTFNRWTPAAAVMSSMNQLAAGGTAGQLLLVNGTTNSLMVTLPTRVVTIAAGQFVISAP